jgi:hypothetical protein
MQSVLMTIVAVGIAVQFSLVLNPFHLFTSKQIKFSRHLLLEMRRFQAYLMLLFLFLVPTSPQVHNGIQCLTRSYPIRKPKRRDCEELIERIQALHEQTPRWPIQWVTDHCQIRIERQLNRIGEMSDINWDIIRAGAWAIVQKCFRRESQSNAGYDHAIGFNPAEGGPGVVKIQVWGMFPQRSITPEQVEETKGYLWDDLKKSGIRASASTFTSPLLFREKSGGGSRLLVDYRAINAIPKGDTV